MEILQAKAVTPGSFDAVKAGEAPKGLVNGGAATVAYLVPWGTSGAGKLLIAALREGLEAWSSDKPFTQKGRQFPAGTVIFRVNENPPALAAAMTPGCGVRIGGGSHRHQLGGRWRQLRQPPRVAFAQACRGSGLG